MMENKYSTTMWIALKWLVLNCTCHTCKKQYVLVTPTTVMKLTKSVEEFKLPIIQCKYCKTTDVVYTIEDVKNKPPKK